MEDYSTVIWVVAIFAAMLFNATSQARKKAKKQAHETQKHTQHEAWPSWDTQSADEMRHPDSQESVSGAETDRLRPAMQQPAPTPGFGEVARKTADFKSSGRHTGRKNAPDGRHRRNPARRTRSRGQAYDSGGCSGNYGGFRPAQGSYLLGDTQAQIQRRIRL